MTDQEARPERIEVGIEVHIPMQALYRVGQAATAYTMDRLRNAGIPVSGGLTPDRVDHGTLTFYRDLSTRDFIYRWKPDARTPCEWLKRTAAALGESR